MTNDYNSETRLAHIAWYTKVINSPGVADSLKTALIAEVARLKSLTK